MPEPSGTGAAPEDQSAAAGSAGATNEGGGSATGSQPDDAKARQDAKLSAEAAKYRVQLRETQKQFDTLKAELEELKAAKEAGSPASNQDASELATLKREMANLQKSLKEQQDRAAKAEEMSKGEKLDSALFKAISDAKLSDPEDVAVILRAKGRARIADDGKAVFVISENGEEREVVITAEAIKQHKLVSDKFYPAEGAAGSGSRGGSNRGNAPSSGLDYERGLRDPAYFAANAKAMEAETRRRLG